VLSITEELGSKQQSYLTEDDIPARAKEMTMVGEPIALLDCSGDPDAINQE